MDDKKYRVVFTGRIEAGADLGQVKQSLAKSLKIDPSATDRLFSGKPMIVKKDADLQSCERLQQAFKRSGALCEIEEQGRKPEKAAVPPPTERKGHQTPPPLPPRDSRRPAPLPTAHVTRGPDEKFCDQCGALVEMNALTCPACGRKFEPRKMGCLPKAAIALGVGFVLLAVLGILAAIAIPQFMVYRHRAYEASVRTELSRVVEAERAYHKNHGVYTQDIEDLALSSSDSSIVIEIIQADQDCFEAEGTHESLPDRVIRADCNGVKEMSVTRDPGG
jgi:Tfp pilus assembly protein PilE